MARLSLLGGVTLQGDDGATLPLAARRHPVTLLALLATAPLRTISRGKLTGLLWPESPDSKARSRLGTCVHQVRQHTGAGVLRSLGGELRLDCELLECDVCAFEDALDAGRTEAAVAIYRGPLLDGFRLPGGVELEQRIERERARLRRRFRSALEELADRAEERGEVATAAELWQRLFDDDPYDSRVAHRLMLARAASGNRAAALRVADRHADLLAAEVGTEPSSPVQELAAGLRRGEEPPGEGSEPGSPGAPRSVAVLPFQSLGEAAEARVLAEGLHGDLLTELSRLPSLLVISRSSVRRYRDAPPGVREVARELGVGAVVEGEVQQSGDRVRLRVQLVDAERDVHLWAERYDRRLGEQDLFTLQSELTREITRALETELSGGERERLGTPATTDLEAYRLYVSGRVHLEQRSPAGMRRAAELFRQATERDGAYAAAWAGLASTLGLRVSYYQVRPEAALDEALKAARRALELDPDLAEAHVGIGLVRYGRPDGPGPRDAFRRAIALRPGYAEAHALLSYLYLTLGHDEEAIGPMERAARLDPLSPEPLWGLAWLASMHGAGSVEEALRHVRRAEDLSPGYAEAYELEGQILALAGRLDEALPALRRGLELAGDGARPRHLSSLLYAHVLAGEAERAEAALGELEEAGSDFYLGKALAALGRTDDAFRHLRRARWDHPGTCAYLRYEPALEPLRADPRYGEIITEVNVLWGLTPEGRMPGEPDGG